MEKKDVEKMVKDIAMMKADMQVDRIFHLMDVRGVLTPEQLKKAEELRDKFRKRRMFRDQRDEDRRPGRPPVR